MGAPPLFRFASTISNIAQSRRAAHRQHSTRACNNNTPEDHHEPQASTHPKPKQQVQLHLKGGLDERSSGLTANLRERSERLQPAGHGRGEAPFAPDAGQQELVRRRRALVGPVGAAELLHSLVRAPGKLLRFAARRKKHSQQAVLLAAGEAAPQNKTQEAA